MTKKQIAALSNIIANENARLEERKSAVKPGIHAAWDKWIVTDGISAVLLAEKPDGLPEGEEMRKIYEMVEREVKRGDSVLACTATVEKNQRMESSGKAVETGQGQQDRRNAGGDHRPYGGWTCRDWILQSLVSGKCRGGCGHERLGLHWV